ncbi:unnamed protein product [Periconia digitata]|uniref:Uncharacterized protein n=1 Tax=Periconia digitata TaxID=1303443 RepID=A0A9W4XGH4_9PLEO|nr:unnamed protein product [Periconia digitata]
MCSFSSRSDHAWLCSSEVGQGLEERQPPSTINPTTNNSMKTLDEVQFNQALFYCCFYCTQSPVFCRENAGVALVEFIGKKSSAKLAWWRIIPRTTTTKPSTPKNQSHENQSHNLRIADSFKTIANQTGRIISDMFSSVVDQCWIRVVYPQWLSTIADLSDTAEARSW